MKKLISILLSIVMLISSMSIGITTYAQESLTITGNKISAKIGDTIEVPVAISEEKEFLGFGFEISYDSSILTPISVAPDSALSDGIFNDSIGTEAYSNPFRVAWAGSNSKALSGTLFTVSFSVIGADNTEISVSTLPYDTYDAEYNKIIIDKANIEVSVGHNHIYSVITVPATCLSTGVVTKTCDVCGEVQNEIIPALNHEFDVKTVSGTCISNGTISYTCKNCGYSYSEITGKIPHRYVLTTVSNSTCTENGYKLYTCSFCGATKKEIISATGHSVVNDPAVAATYEKAGKTAGSHCSKCGKVIVAQKTVAKLTVAKTTISSLTAKSKGFTVKWKKNSKATGYQIQYSVSSKFSKAKTVTVSKNSTLSKTFSKLTGKKKYYVRVRCYKTYNGKKYYSAWSASKSVTTKK